MNGLETIVACVAAIVLLAAVLILIIALRSRGQKMSSIVPLFVAENNSGTSADERIIHDILVSEVFFRE